MNSKLFDLSMPGSSEIPAPVPSLSLSPVKQKQSRQQKEKLGDRVESPKTHGIVNSFRRQFPKVVSLTLDSNFQLVFPLLTVDGQKELVSSLLLKKAQKVQTNCVHFLSTSGFHLTFRVHGSPSVSSKAHFVLAQTFC